MKNLTDGIKAVIFDFDGTLYNPKGLRKRLVLSTIMTLPLVLADRKFRRLNRGRDFGSSENFYREYYKFISSHSLSSLKRAMFWKPNVYMAAMVKILRKGFTAEKDVQKLLDYLKSRNVAIAVFSDYNWVEERLVALGVSDLSGVPIYDSESVGALKPCTRGFLKIAEDLCVDPSAVLVVGDRYDADGKGAINSGMKFIQIKTRKKQNLPPDYDHPIVTWNEFLDAALKNF